jgi:hypothetical protein
MGQVCAKISREELGQSCQALCGVRNQVLIRRIDVERSGQHGRERGNVFRTHGSHAHRLAWRRENGSLRGSHTRAL